MFNLSEALKKCKNSIVDLNSLTEKDINIVLNSCAEQIIIDKEYIKDQNIIDIEKAQKNGKSEAFIDRLKITDNVIFSMAESIRQVAKIKSPTDKIFYKHHNRKQGIKIIGKSVPFGVIGIIYEARPNVTADAFSLCFKTKNAVVLKGGSDAINSNIAIAKSIKAVLISNDISENAIMVIEDTSREATMEFMKAKEYVDLLIPRGSASLIKSAVQNSTIPIIETGAGNCHVYVDEFADIEKAVKIIYNAKTQRYSVCNACESLVIHSNILEKALPKIYEKLKEKEVKFYCDERALPFVKDGILASSEDFYTEYLGPSISVKVVDSLDEAISHINEHSTHHSESIVTENKENAKTFRNLIDSSCVYTNASTRFTDGFVFGFGAEIGISTQKLHARGPMGLNALVTKKYTIIGKCAVRK